MIASGNGRDATLALRDLSLRMGSLPRAERNPAYAEFQRPWGDGLYSMKCLSNICVHWKSSSTYPTDQDATDDSYAFGNMTTGVMNPDSVLATLVHVSDTYQRAGYRKPRSDGDYGGTPGGETDIYLRDVGSEGKYGYCTVDVDDNGYYVFGWPAGSRRGDLPAFCVLDNDYSKSQFRTGNSSLDDLKVTAAHEYFHAVQFGYDYLEDRWFMEATATWAEEQVYDAIDDNVQYLQRSQLRYPGVSLDTFNGAGGFLHYGDWLFFEYLTERIPAPHGPMPALMLRMWQLADSVSGPDLYSIQAVVRALAERRVDFNRIFAQYAAANRHPASAYAEGRVNHYPVGAPRRTVKLKPGKRTASGTYRVNHLASATVRFVPKRLRAKRTRLTLSVDMANKKAGSMAVALVFFKNGRIATKIVRLGRTGNGKVRVPFSTRTVARVELVLVNANHAYRSCWSNTVFSCGGIPKQNGVKERFSAKVS
jgi:hypothetical protein